MTSVPDYVELRCRSAFSFLAGASLPEDLVERAAALGYDTLALADARGVYGAPRFFQAARCAGLRALVGAEVAVAGAGSLWLLVEERAGYKNLCRLLTAGALGRVKGAALVTWAEVEEHAAGLHCLAGGAEGPLAGADAAANLTRLKRLFGARLAVDVHRHGERAGERLARHLADLAAAHRVPVVATNDVRHAAPEGRPLLDVLTCIRLGTTLDQAGRRLLANVERHLKPPAAMAALFRDMPEAIRQSRRIAERPDLDLDLPSGDRREEVIPYVYRRYGERGAAMTATVIGYRTRSAVREAGKALGLSLEQVDRLAKLLRAHGWHDEHDELAAQLRAGGVDPEAPRIGLLVELVRQMQGLPRHLGQHTGGMVIAAGRLDEVVPLEPAAMPGRNVIQWDKDDCADLGLIKVDLLGLGMLAALEEAIPLVREHEGIDVDLAHLPPDDPQVYAMLQKADTIGVFQVESRAQMATLPRMRPERFYDLVVEVAIIRPGPIVGQMVNPYLKRRAGREPVRYAHPTLEPILRRTLGVPLFQEQLLRMAMTVAGFTGGEAEELRRAMGFKRSVERMQGIERRLRDGMAARGISLAAQEEIVQQITSFALYGFPESHSASFALIAYASAYLKAHHPAAFACALLNAWPMGFYHPATVVKDAQRHGVAVLPIDVTRSEWRCTIEGVGPGPGGAPRGGGALSPGARDASRPARPWAGAPTAARGTPRPRLAVRLGLRYVPGLRAEAARRIVAGRPFASVAGAAQVGGLRRDGLEALGHGGGFAGFGLTRREALWQAAAVERDPSSLLARVRPPAGDAPLLPMSAFEETAADYAATHLTPGPHIMAYLRDRLRAEGVLAARDLERLPNGAPVRVAGHVIVRQRPGTAKGMCFLTLEDETGTANAVVTPPLYEGSRVVLNTSPLLEVAGRLERVDGVTHVRAARFRRLEAPAEMPEGHDYC